MIPSNFISRETSILLYRTSFYLFTEYDDRASTGKIDRVRSFRLLRIKSERRSQRACRAARSARARELAKDRRRARRGRSNGGGRKCIVLDEGAASTYERNTLLVCASFGFIRSPARARATVARLHRVNSAKRSLRPVLVL